MNIQHKDINNFVKKKKPGFFLSENIFKEAFRLLFNNSPYESTDLSSNYTDTHSNYSNITSSDTDVSVPYPETIINKNKNLRPKNIIDNRSNIKNNRTKCKIILNKYNIKESRLSNKNNLKNYYKKTAKTINPSKCNTAKCKEQFSRLNSDYQYFMDNCN